MMARIFCKKITKIGEKITKKERNVYYNYTLWKSKGATPIIFKDHLKICWWMGVHTPIIIDLEALNKIKYPSFV
jgi:hypothetical protein